MNMETYKRMFIVLVVGILIMPQIALAAWWNPFSWSVWNIFRPTHSTQQTQITTATPTIPLTVPTKKVNADAKQENPKDNLTQKISQPNQQKIEPAKEKQNVIQPTPKQPTPTTKISQEQKKPEPTTIDNALEIQRIAEEQRKQKDAQKIAEEATKKLALENLQKEEEEATVKAEQERVSEAQKLAEQQAAEEKQKELEKQLADVQFAQKKEKELQAKQKDEQQIISQIKSNIAYFTNQINSVNQSIEQTTNDYHLTMEREQVSYKNQIESYKSIYNLSITKRHREILNEASKGIWTDCGWLGDLWDYQDSEYQQYSTNLYNAERTLKSNISFVANSYIPDFNFYLEQINKEQSIHIPTKKILSQYLDQLNSLSISNIETFKNEVSNLMAELNSIESKINNAKSYSVSVTSPSSLLSEIDPLIQEEKAWFGKTSCKNLP